MYLAPAALEATLAVVRDRSAPGSMLLMTYATEEMAAILEGPPQFREVDSIVGRKIESPYAHRASPLHLLLEPDEIGYLNVTLPRSQRTHRRAWP